MINYLVGQIIEKSENLLVIECNNIGFNVNVSQNTLDELPPVGESVKILTYMNVREDDISLFGFGSKAERDMFFKLTTVSGIGPKLSLSILSGMKLNDLVNAIIGENVKFLSTIKGLGRKTAERIILELKDKVTALSQDSEAEILASSNTNIDDAVEALFSLGMNKNDAYKVARACATETSTVEEIVTRALQTMGRQ